VEGKNVGETGYKRRKFLFPVLVLKLQPKVKDQALIVRKVI
jgi:hypothetical protein